MPETILAIDVGTTATKAGIVADGNLVQLAEQRHAPPTSPSVGWVEQQPGAWWDSLVSCVTQLAGAKPDAIAVTGQMQNLILLDSDGAPVRNAILYSDARAVEEHRSAQERLGDEWTDAVGYLPDETTLPAKVRWVQKHEPTIAAGAATVLFGAHSFVVQRLCGAAAVDSTTAATTALYQTGKQRWWEPALDLVPWGMPDLVAVDEPVGTLLPGPAAVLGLPAGIPVVHGPGDAAATTFGAVGDEPATPYVYVGTSGWAAEVEEVFEPRPATITLPAATPGRWIRVAPLIAAGAAIEWAARVMLGDIQLEDLDALVGDTCGAAEGVLFVPTLGGDRGSGDLQAAASLLGARFSTTPSVVAAAVVEGVAHALRLSLLSVAGEPDGPIIATGGAMRLESLGQALADVSSREVRPAINHHQTVIGAAALAAATVAEHSSFGDSWKPNLKHQQAHRWATAALERVNAGLLSELGSP